MGCFGGPIWEGTCYENIEIESLRVTAIPNRCIQSLFYCSSKHKFINLHQIKPQYKYIPLFLPCAYAPFSKSYHLISTCFHIIFFWQQQLHNHHCQIWTKETYVKPTYTPVQFTCVNIFIVYFPILRKCYRKEMLKFYVQTCTVTKYTMQLVLKLYTTYVHR